MKAMIKFENGGEVELVGEKADKLYIEFAVKKFRRGDKFKSYGETFILTCFWVDFKRYWFLVETENGMLKNSLPREIETFCDNVGYYITKLPTIAPEDFGLEEKYGS